MTKPKFNSVKFHAQRIDLFEYQRKLEEKYEQKQIRRCHRFLEKFFGRKVSDTELNIVITNYKKTWQNDSPTVAFDQWVKTNHHVLSEDITQK